MLTEPSSPIWIESWSQRPQGGLGVCQRAAAPACLSGNSVLQRASILSY